MIQLNRKTLFIYGLIATLVVSAISIYLSWSSTAPYKKRLIRIAEMKIATAIDENLMPVKALYAFPKETSKVYCWFKWRNAKAGTVILADWHYVTDDIPVLNTAILIPTKIGVGSVSLTMPEGKTLPPGLYRVELFLGKQSLRNLFFKVSQ